MFTDVASMLPVATGKMGDSVANPVPEAPSVTQMTRMFVQLAIESVSKGASGTHMKATFCGMVVKSVSEALSVTHLVVPFTRLVVILCRLVDNCVTKGASGTHRPSDFTHTACFCVTKGPSGTRFRAKLFRFAINLSLMKGQRPGLYQPVATPWETISPMNPRAESPAYPASSLRIDRAYSPLSYRGTATPGRWPGLV